jgi:EAL domain-containing protein (putative c-di-GMP-specific phosphodiesterase class I)
MEEAVVLRDLGVRLFQGYLLAKPALEHLPPIAPGLSERIRASHESSLLERRETALGRRA